MRIVPITFIAALVTALLTFNNTVSAQSDSLEIVDVSKLTGGMKGFLPFDREFYVRIPKTKELTITNVEIFKEFGDAARARRRERNNLGTDKNFSPNEKYRIVDAYGKGNYSRGNSSSPREYGRIMLLKGVQKGGTPPTRTQLEQRETNIIEKDDYVLVKIFPLVPSSHYGITYDFQGKDAKVKSSLDKILRQKVSSEAGRSKLAEGVSEVQKILPKTVFDFGTLERLAQEDFLSALSHYNDIANAIDEMSVITRSDYESQSEYNELVHVKDSLVKISDTLSSISTRKELLDLSRNNLEKEWNKFKEQLPAAIRGRSRKEILTQLSLTLLSDAKKHELIKLDSLYNAVDAEILKSITQSENYKRKQTAFLTQRGSLSRRLADSVGFRSNYMSQFRLYCNKKSSCLEENIERRIFQGELEKAVLLLVHYDDEHADPEEKTGLQKKINDGSQKLKVVNELPDTSAYAGFLRCYFNEVIVALYLCDTCQKKGVIGQRLNLMADSLVIRRSSLETENLKKIALGLLPINYSNTSEAVSITAIAERKANLITSMDVVEHLSKIYMGNKRICNDYTKLLALLQSKIDQIDSYFSVQSSLLSAVYNYKISSIPVMSVYIANTVMGFSKGASTATNAGKFNVRPDFGMAYYTNFQYGHSQRNLFNGFVPYFGVRFNFTPLDINRPYRHFRHKTWLHRSSLNLSWSFISITDNKTRFNALKDVNFLIGYGFRITNVLNLNVGTMLFTKEHPDPFITRRQLAAVPYFGVTFDFDLLDAFEDLTKLFKP